MAYDQEDLEILLLDNQISSLQDHEITVLDWTQDAFERAWWYTWAKQLDASSQSGIQRETQSILPILGPHSTDSVLKLIKSLGLLFPGDYQIKAISSMSFQVSSNTDSCLFFRSRSLMPWSRSLLYWGRLPELGRRSCWTCGKLPSKGLKANMVNIMHTSSASILHFLSCICQSIYF